MLNQLTIQEVIEWALLVAIAEEDRGSPLGDDDFVEEVEWARHPMGRHLRQAVHGQIARFREKYYA